MGAAMIATRDLPVARYRFTFRTHDELRLPDFAGSLLRGQFGEALRRTVCVTDQASCAACPLYRSCLFPAIFDTPAPAEHHLQKFSAVPNPYVIEPPPIGTTAVAAGRTLSFKMVLVGRTLQQLPLVTFALQRAFRQGLGLRRAKGELEDVVWERPEGGDASVWDTRTRSIVPQAPSLRVPAALDSGTATLRISTPLRLQNQGRPLGPNELNPRALITAILRRASLLFEMHAGLACLVPNPTELAHIGDRLNDERDLHWHDWQGFSSRQRQEMKLGGVIGEWKLHGEIGALSQWLWLGQWLHAGKNATMGLGRYEVAFS
jgi:hypothetical protein